MLASFANWRIDPDAAPIFRFSASGFCLQPISAVLARPAGRWRAAYTLSNLPGASRLS